jgi:hypothetical protein
MSGTSAIHWANYSFFRLHSSQILYAALDRGPTLAHADLRVPIISKHALARTWFCVNKISGLCNNEMKMGALHNGHPFNFILDQEAWMSTSMDRPGDSCQRPHSCKFENIWRKIHSAQNEWPQFRMYGWPNISWQLQKQVIKKFEDFISHMGQL